MPPSVPLVPRAEAQLRSAAHRLWSTSRTQPPAAPPSARGFRATFDVPSEAELGLRGPPLLLRCEMWAMALALAAFLGVQLACSLCAARPRGS